MGDFYLVPSRMKLFIVAAVVILSTSCTYGFLSDILADLKHISPYLMRACRPLSAPVNGRVACVYNLVNLTCNAQCNAGYRFLDGSANRQLVCTFEKQWGDVRAFPQCIRSGSGTSTGGTGTGTNTGTANIAGCVHSEMECRSLSLGDYPSCFGCDRYVTCANDGAFDRMCPPGTFFDNASKRCEIVSSTCSS